MAAKRWASRRCGCLHSAQGRMGTRRWAAQVEVQHTAAGIRRGLPSKAILGSARREAGAAAAAAPIVDKAAAAAVHSG